jgi:hypothetical protein
MTVTRDIAATLSGLFPGAAEHPLAQLDEPVLVPAGHGVGQLAQLNGKLIQILVHEATPNPRRGCENTKCVQT